MQDRNFANFSRGKCSSRKRSNRAASALVSMASSAVKKSGASAMCPGRRFATYNFTGRLKILQAKAPDLQMQADDILGLPSSTGKVIGGATLQAALQAATLLSVAAVP